MSVPNKRARSVAFVAAAAVTLILGGCTTSDNLGTVLVAPGKFRFYTCPDLINRHKAIVARQRELEALIGKAGQDAGGRFVSSIAYEADYATTKGEMRVLQQEAAEKNCRLPETSPAAAAPAAKPATGKKR